MNLAAKHIKAKQRAHLDRQAQRSLIETAGERIESLKSQIRAREIEREGARSALQKVQMPDSNGGLLRDACRELGCIVQTIEIDEINIDAPHGHVFSGSGLHYLVSGGDVEPILYDMADGLEPCTLDGCDICTED